ncbi:MAG: flagellar basal-body protein FlbY [Hyphomonadaceae bacterium]|nr:flagellar basal-body protein FlbY [Hyphomonadaceae bacterium]
MTVPAQSPHGSPTERADQLLAMTKRLVALVTAEIDALKAKRLDGASADWDEKERLAHAWRLEVAYIKANPSALAGVADDRKQALRDSAKRLEEQLEAHARALVAMKTVTEGLVRSIASEIATVRSGPVGYGRAGTVNTATKREASGLAVDAKA